MKLMAKVGAESRFVDDDVTIYFLGPRTPASPVGEREAQFIGVL